VVPGCGEKSEKRAGCGVWCGGSEIILVRVGCGAVRVRSDRQRGGKVLHLTQNHSDETVRSPETTMSSAGRAMWCGSGEAAAEGAGSCGRQQRGRSACLAANPPLMFVQNCQEERSLQEVCSRAVEDSRGVCPQRRQHISLPAPQEKELLERQPPAAYEGIRLGGRESTSVRLMRCTNSRVVFFPSALTRVPCSLLTGRWLSCAVCVSPEWWCVVCAGQWEGSGGVVGGVGGGERWGGGEGRWQAVWRWEESGM